MIPLFNFFLARDVSTSSYYARLLAQWLSADRAFFASALPPNASAWGREVGGGRLFGCGAGPGPLGGYSVERIEGNDQLVVSAHIMAGFAGAVGKADARLRTQLLSTLGWMYESGVCAYDIAAHEAEGRAAAQRRAPAPPRPSASPRVLWRCALRRPKWRASGADSIDFSTMVLGLGAASVRPGFFEEYAA